MIILASKSPRRQQLLKLLGLDYTVKVADIDEAMDESLPPRQEVERVARQKAAAIAETAAEDDVVISADTIVVIDGTVLGKPGSKEKAAAMLRRLSGRTHEVMTGLCVRRGGKILSDVVISQVTFRPLSDAEIAAYIETGEPMDKAGSYGIQGYGALLVEGIEGDYFNVVGLPVCRLGRMLARFGVNALALAAQKEKQP